ncbi:Myosin-binding protein 1 [Linum perenne]
MGRSKVMKPPASSRKSLDIRSVLASAVLEWLLILMLLVNATFSYLISTFAQYCGLQAPCPQCSRLDHILGSRKLKHYWDLVCRNHKLEISSLVLCHAHNTLVDVHGMCETCLFSFATTNKSNAETYRLLVGKLGKDSGFDHDEESSSGEQSLKARNCSCCNEPCTSRGVGKKLMKFESTGSEGFDFNAPIFTSVERDQESPKSSCRAVTDSTTVKSREVDPLSHVEVNADSDAVGLVHESDPLIADESVEYVPSVPEDSTLDPLAHVGYTEVNADSDAEYEPRGSVQEVGISGLVHETHPLMADETLEPHDSSLDPLTHVGYTEVKADSDAESEDRMSNKENDASVAAHETHPLMSDVSIECVSREAFAVRLSEDSVLDPPADVGYPQVKVCSDAESDDQASDDEDDADASAHETHPLVEDVALECVTSEPDVVILPEGQTTENLMDQVSETEPSVLVSEGQLDPLASHNVTSATSTVADAHDFEELNWQQAEKTEPSAVPELICLDEDPSPSVASVFPVEATEEDKFISSEDVPPQSNDREEIVVETSSKEINMISIDEVSSPLDVTETGVEALEESKLISIDDASPTFDSTSCLPLELTKGSKPIEDGGLSSSEEVETPVEGLKENSDTRKEDIWEPSAIDTEQGPETTDTFSESNHVSSDNSSHWHNLLDLGDAYKLAVGNKGRHLSGLLSEQWLGKDSSRLSEDLRNLASQLSGIREQSLSDASPRVSMSPRVPMSPKLSLNSDEWRMAADASSTTGVQMLQKRMSLERNESGLSLDGSLVSEIEGETLVDRLKRQVDHDKKLLNVLYKELEEERNASAIAANQAMAMITRLQEEKASFQMEAQQCLRVMEDQAEYDMEALQKMNDLLVEKEKEIQDLEADLEFYRNTFHPDVENAADIRVDRVEEASGVEDRSLSEVKKSMLELEDERSYISTRLKKLEEKLHMFSNGGDGVEIEKPSLPPAEMDLELLAHEVTDLNERLGTLEADRNFLEHSIKSMTNGEEGIRLIHEIASDLRELRSIGIRRQN